MTSVGSILRSARERHGRGVAEIAGELCLTQHYLLAIEDDDVKSLPGVFFYKNFVKQYAAIVGVNEAELRAGVDALTAAAEEPVLPGALAQSPVRPMDPIVADNNRRYFANARLGVSVAGLAAALLACSGFYAWWSRPAQAAATARRTPPPMIQPAPPSLPVVSTVVPVPAVSTPTQNPAAETAPVKVTAEALTQTTVDGINHVVLNLSATEKTWLSITSEGKRLFSGFLEPSQTKTLTGLEVARMTVGNAGGIEVRLNGKPIGPIGKSGQVRVVVFTPDNFQVLPLETPVLASETL
ncbi:MAG: transcriptional regulator, family [Bryobacterales bacterium]|nr:transcriptional regulator, family [Bryobacterales bacterium]